MRVKSGSTSLPPEGGPDLSLLAWGLALPFLGRITIGSPGLLILVFTLLVIALICFFGFRNISRIWRSPLYKPPVRTKAKMIGGGSCDPLRYKLFEDSIAALSQGAGVDTPQLLVAELAYPLAWCEDAALTKGTKGTSLVITKDLMHSDLTGPEVEAICADLLSKLVNRYQGDTGIVKLAKQVQFNMDLFAEVEYQLRWTQSPYLPLMILLQDTWAARLTMEPAALRTAIVKSLVMLKDMPVYSGFTDPMVFVFPPFAGTKNVIKPFDYKMDLVVGMARARDRIVQWRLQNLKLMEHGTRQPHQFIQGASPVTGPDGWK